MGVFPRHLLKFETKLQALFQIHNKVVRWVSIKKTGLNPVYDVFD